MKKGKIRLISIMGVLIFSGIVNFAFCEENGLINMGEAPLPIKSDVVREESKKIKSEENIELESRIPNIFFSTENKTIAFVYDDKTQKTMVKEKIFMLNTIKKRIFNKYNDETKNR